MTEQTGNDRFAVLVDVGCDWPEVVFVGGYADAANLARTVSDELAVSVQAVVALDDAVAEIGGDRPDR